MDTDGIHCRLNSTMVRLKQDKVYYLVDDFLCLNSTMVRLKHSQEVFRKGESIGLNSTMVRLKL